MAIRIWAAVRRKQRAVRGSDMTAAAWLPHRHEGCVAIWIRTRLRVHHCGDEVVMKAACGLTWIRFEAASDEEDCVWIRIEAALHAD